MKKIKLLAIAMIAVLPAVSQAQNVQTYFGANYEYGNVKIGSHHTNVDGFKFQAGSELGKRRIKPTFPHH
ncbi:hypothetical protein L4D08_25445 [Photobacterium chitinilyticum]|uniref:hypothetical protein n=1 Tax=Photobacterium chitinilyticum TaxID=2485123 RepID=UPI003D09A7C7